MNIQNGKIFKWYIAVYSLLCINIPILILPESLLNLKYIIGEKTTDFICDFYKFSEHIIVPFLVFNIVFTVFMLFFAFRIKSVGIEKTALIVLANVLLPHLALWAQTKKTLILIVTILTILIISYTIHSVLKIAEENKTEVA